MPTRFVFVRKFNGGVILAYNRTTNTNNQRTQRRSPSRSQASKLKVIPLGGLHEVGKNITAFEYEDEIMLVFIVK